MKSLLFPIFVFSFLLSYSNSACDNLYSNVTYALSHSNKALSATNFEHQMYYAERALIAMQKVEALRNDCGCAETEDKTYTILKNLNKAIEPIDWDAGRFFTKKSKSLINELITVLDECSMSKIQKSDAEEAHNDESPKNPSNLESLDVKTLALAKYISKVDKSLQTTEQEINRLLQALDIANHETTSAITLQKKIYLERSKKLLQNTLDKLKTEN